MQTTPNIDNYIKNFPEPVREKLNAIRELVKKMAPDAQEAIKYGIPTFVLNENLVHFAAFKNHIGFYPSSSGTSAFKNELVKYKSSKGAIQFPLDQPLPLAFIKKIVKFRINEARDKAKK
jgi:uncharacterized protein YdhG (YjbR/CyaY superfamily)